MKYVILVGTLVNHIEYVVNAQRKTVNPSPHLPDVAKSVLALVPVSEITYQTVRVTIQSHVTHAGSGSSFQCLNTYAIYGSFHNSGYILASGKLFFKTLFPL